MDNGPIEREIFSKLEFIIAHDYLLIKGENNSNREERVSIQIPINEAKTILTELLKEDYLQDSHVDKYPSYNNTEVTIHSSKGWTKTKIV